MIVTERANRVMTIINFIIANNSDYSPAQVALAA